MSQQRYIGLLAHYQPVGARVTHIHHEVAEELVRRLAAEKITSKLIRMFPPDSVFLKTSPSPFKQYIPEKLGPGEVAGVKFMPPSRPLAQSGIPRVCRLPRYREVFGQDQLARSV